MTTRSGSRSSARTRTGIRTTRRLSPCYRHPNEPLTGICPSCLRERLSGLDASSSAASTEPVLRRCRSVVSVSNCEASSSSFHEPRRKSCDVVSSRSSLSNLLHDVETGSDDADVKVETKNLGLSRVTYTVVDTVVESIDEEARVSVEKRRVLNGDFVDSDEEFGEGEFRTMKEYIDLEFQNKSKKSKDLREIAGSFWGAASVFSKRLRELRQKSKWANLKKLSSGGNEKGADGGDRNLRLFENGQRIEQNHSEIVGRRSCDMEPRFSVDGGGISFEEPRASWDGYMIARTIPRLAPMISSIENGILGNVNNRFENHRFSIDGPMHAIMEDDSSSRGSGNSHSDSSSSMTESSFDRSSSVKSSGKKVLSSEDHVLSPANVKLVITEKELKDWHLTSSRGEGLEKLKLLPRDTAPVYTSNLNMTAKKSVRWRKVCNVFGFKPKCNENKPEAFKGNASDPLIVDINEKQVKEAGGEQKGINGWKLTRSSSVVGSRTSCDAVGSSYRRRSVDNAGAWAFKREFTPANGSSKELEDGMKPFYMTPLRSPRRSKSGKFKLQNSHCIAGDVLQLN